jgi:hypothetical protein
MVQCFGLKGAPESIRQAGSLAYTHYFSIFRQF